jgi:putative membrane protein
MRRIATAVVAALSITALTASVPSVGSAQSAGKAPSLDDATIVAIFDAANGADIETGSLAAKRAESAEVREYGAMIARDHEKVRQMGRDLAARLGVTPTPPRDDRGAKDHAAAMERLRGLRGAAFDHAFLQHEAAFHASVIEAVRTTLLPAIKNPELKTLVEQVAPAFQAHMLAAQNLEKKLATR